MAIHFPFCPAETYFRHMTNHQMQVLGEKTAKCLASERYAAYTEEEKDRQLFLRRYFFENASSAADDRRHQQQ